MHTARRRNDYLRACDDCGHKWPFFKLKYIGLNKWVCPDDKRTLTREQYARHLSRPIPSIFGPRKHAKDSPSVGIYQSQEADHFNIAITYGITGDTIDQSGEIISTPSSLSRVTGPVESLRYLAKMVRDNNRPASWVAKARTMVVQLADYLLTLQEGSPTGVNPSVPVNYQNYGGIGLSASFSIRDTAIGGLGLLDAYRITGETKYLNGVIRVATFVRNTQRVDLNAFKYTTSSSGGTGRKYLGGWPDSVNDTGALPGNSFTEQAATALWFLADLKTALGGTTVIGSPAGNDNVSSTEGTINDSISEGLAFYLGGSYLLAPISATTPRSYLAAFLNSGSGDGLFHFYAPPTIDIRTLEYAYALRACYEAEGYSERVAAVYEYLLAFDSNASTEPTGDETRALLENGLLGTYDPTFALAEYLLVTANTNSASSRGYDFTATALLAPLTIASGRTLRRAKDELGRAHQLVSGPQGKCEAMKLGPIGLSGLTYQLPADTVFGTNIISGRSAATAELYRYAPQAWSGLQ